MNDLVSWAAIESELSKGEQMGFQTVAQFAKVGQMLIEKMGDMSIREFVPCVGQHIPRLTKSTIHRYMMLAKHLPLLEAKQPDSQRAALALIREANAPKAIPMPAPEPAPSPKPMPAPAPDERREQAEARMAALPEQFNLSEPMKVRYEKAVNRAIKEIYSEFHTSVDEAVEREINARLAKRIEYYETQRAKADAERAMWESRNENVTTLLTEEEFKLIRGCLHADRVPEDLKARFDKAFVAFNKLSRWFEDKAAVEKRLREKSERAKAMWAARKADKAA